MEIERKFLIPKLPEDLTSYAFHEIEQGYLCVSPTVRVRKEDDSYYMTYKGSGLMAREEYNLPLSKEGYEHLKAKADGLVITKTRYLIPIEEGLTIELDVFHNEYEGLWLAEVEFASVAQAESFTPPDWFGEDVTCDGRYHNSNMSQR